MKTSISSIPDDHFKRPPQDGYTAIPRSPLNDDAFFNRRSRQLLSRERSDLLRRRVITPVTACRPQMMIKSDTGWSPQIVVCPF